MEDSFSRSFFFFLSYGICLNGVMSPFPTPIQPASGHHRQGKLEGNFHIKDEGLAGFKLNQVMQRKQVFTGRVHFCCSVATNSFLITEKKTRPGSLFIFQPGAVINFSSAWLGGMEVDRKACKLVNRIKVALLRDVGLKNRP